MKKSFVAKPNKSLSTMMPFSLSRLFSEILTLRREISAWIVEECDKLFPIFQYDELAQIAKDQT
jgi:hypothetical protein